MKEINEKELNEVNGGSISDWAEKKKEQIEKWEKNSHNPVTPISDPLLPDVDIPDDLLDKIVAGREDITNENVVGGPLNPAIDNKDIPTDEETWLG